MQQPVKGCGDFYAQQISQDVQIFLKSYYSDSIRGTAVVLICYNSKAFTKMSSLVVETSPMGLTIFYSWMITMQISTGKIQYACLVYQSIPCCTEQNMFGYLQYIQYAAKIFTIKIQNLNIKSGVFFLYKNLFFFVRLNRFLYIWVLKCKFSACRFLNH